MFHYQHSVSLETDKCRGCTHCLKRCPTEAIRVRNGHAVINSNICIDCGECIRVCPYQAKKATFDKLEDIDHSRYVIALPPPTLYGQFSCMEDVDYLVSALHDCGFDNVFEVARAAEILTEYTRHYMRREDITYPVINSACPVIVRLISLRFPSLCEHIMPMLAPIEIASRMAKEEALKSHPALSAQDVCTVFISPCPAKASYIKNGFGNKKSTIDYVVSMSEVYFKLLGAIKKLKNPKHASKTGMIGMSWATTGGESSALMNDHYLAADGIENVIRVLDDIETGSFAGLRFVELNACPGGCVGGVATVENPYIARVRLQILRRYLPVSRNRIPKGQPDGDDYVPESFLFETGIPYNPAFQLDENRSEAMRKLSRIETICDELPALDCGFCGAPTCRAFAQDVVQGESKMSECLVRMREQMQDLIEKHGEQAKGDCDEGKRAGGKA